MKSGTKEGRRLEVLLALIALALFANALNPWLLPEPVAAQRPPADLPMMEVHLRNMDRMMEEHLENVDRSTDGMADDLERLVTLVTRVEGALDDPATCEWTLVGDAPTAAANGQILTTGDWAGVASGAWSLKVVSGDGYVFERCR